ncbi:F0F1-type ATP synthase assembly protein I [Altererythrobacter atlanticus]|uniref:Uncharacterized protein n=1 Tax=Croceibacterium atlanticum TaxID=1267766 RepID=A0A0F7KLT3_9SPHN|nr:phage holin family protein [Croceibacterium atlanticum]AKH41488.1 hypothetical protein WYH_00429 [Croceibacterium atlanticum]MBB5732950.1 F0F1-type ATP synthase assembly protein I [Croceibacterium atlanticum]
MSAGKAEDGLDLPEDGPMSADEKAAHADRSLLEDVEALVEDGRTYLEAELNFQKTRAAFAADRAKKIAALGIGAAIVVFLALIGLTVGLIIAFMPMLTPWGATALIVGLWLLAAFLMLRKAASHWEELMSAFDNGEGEDE